MNQDELPVTQTDWQTLRLAGLLPAGTKVKFRRSSSLAITGKPGATATVDHVASGMCDRHRCARYYVDIGTAEPARVCASVFEVIVD